MEVLKWCASSSAFALRQTVLDCDPPELISRAILRSMYVDDLLISLPDVDDVISLIDGIRSVLAYGSFNLTKFMANDDRILNHIEVGN